MTKALKPAKKQQLPSGGTGRKRDPSLDANILEAAIATLASVGFDTMTMDQVAACAGSAKTTVYRRWSSKAELVRDALIYMSRRSVNLDEVPDTGSLRNDLLATQKEYSKDFAEQKIRVLSGLGSFQSEHPEFRNEAFAGIFEPMNELNRKLMTRARDRGEISKHADIEMAIETIAATIAYRTSVQLKSFDKTQFAKVLDTMILPALKSAGSKKQPSK